MKITSEQKLLPESGKTIKKIVIMLHGYGSSGSDLIELAPYLSSRNPDVAFFSPDAPNQMDHLTGYEWFSLDSREEEFMYNGLCKVMDCVTNYIAQKVAEHKVGYENIYLLGFSQGSMLAMHVGLRMQEKIGGIIGFSGKIVKPSSLKGELKHKIPTLLVHGQHDDVVPYFLMEEASNALSKLDIDVKCITESGLAHSVGNKGIKAAAEFIHSTK